jgi:hypothetical protein
MSRTKRITLAATADRLLMTCRVELLMLFAGAVVLALVIGEGESFTKRACVAIGWMVIGAALSRFQLKLRQ